LRKGQAKKEFWTWLGLGSSAAVRDQHMQGQGLGRAIPVCAMGHARGAGGAKITSFNNCIDHKRCFSISFSWRACLHFVGSHWVVLSKTMT
jgi:hypothetical protein